MKRFTALVFWLATAFALCVAVLPARAQQDQSAKPIKARFEVLHMLRTGIQVRSLANEKEIHTFTYSDHILDRMQNMFDQGGYQYGDKVSIVYQPGSQIALKIKGKPSKPL
jgi:hypothetical protein